MRRQMFLTATRDAAGLAMVRQTVPRILFAMVVVAATAADAGAQGSLEPPADALANGTPVATMKTMNQIEPRTLISSLPYRITTSGSYYVTQPLVGVAGSNGISVGASNVRIDLSGFPISGVSNALDGIAVDYENDNVVIRNGVIRNWPGFAVNGNGTKDMVFADLKAYGNGCGGLYAGALALVERCGAYGNGFSAPTNDPPSTDGIQVGAYSTVSDCKSSWNKGAGIHTYNHGRVSECVTTESNEANGIWAEDYCTIQNCTVSKNAGHGIRVGNKCRVVANTCGENGINNPGPPSAGILVSGWNNLVEDNNVCGNDNGIDVQGGGNLIVRNSASKNTNVADYVYGVGNYVGAVVQPPSSGEFTNNNPWTNFKFQ